MRSERFTQENEGNFTFKGSFSEAMGELHIYATNGYVYGNIHIDSLAYQIEPVNKKYALLLRRDYSGTICPLGEEYEDGGKAKMGYDNQEPNFSISSTNPVIDVMVVFSNQAAAATADMEALALGSIQSSNTTFSNSNAGVTFNLVHYQQVNYDDSGNSLTDVNRLEGTSDGYIDNIHSLRDQYGADVVILMVNSTDACGRASEIGANSSEAFAITVNSCSIGNYTFAHEIGHLAGARHDNDGTGSPYAYGHGFRFLPAYWRTVMGIRNYSGDPTNRIPYWSNPDKYYGGVAMGSSSWRDNARVWDERAATVAGFKSNAPDVSISGPSQLQQGQYGTWTASASGGTSSTYSYEWFYRSADTNNQWYGPIDYDNSYSTQMYAFDEYLELRAEVGDGTSIGTQTKYVSCGDCTGGGGPLKEVAEAEEVLPQQFTLSNNYPNPFNPSTQINFELPEIAEVSIKVYNIMGQQVAALVNTTMSAGFHEVSFDAGGLSSGMYIARMEAVGESGTRFNRELKMQLIK